MSKKRWLTLLLIVVLASVYRIVLQVAFLSGSNSNSTTTPSVIVQSGLIPVVFTFYCLMTYGLVAIVFVLIQDGLPGNKTAKGLMFGLMFGLMWVLYLLEPLPNWEGTPLIDLIGYPVSDCTTLLLLGGLLGRYIGTDSNKAEKVSVSSGTVALVSILVPFLAGRYLEYNVIHIYSDFTARPLLTILWAAVTGLLLAVMYLFLSPGIAVKSHLAKAAFFGFVVVGIDLLLFNYFIMVVFETDFAGFIDLTLRSLIDIVAVTAGAVIYEKVRYR